MPTGTAAQKSKSRATVLCLLGIFVLGLFLRVYGIGWGLPNKGCFVSYKSDENIYIRSISQMDPSRLDFNPRFFYWGSWHFYELALALKVAQAFHFIHVSPDKHFYYVHPEETARIYLVGRMLSVVFGIAAILLVYLLGTKMDQSPVALTAAFLLAVMPAHAVNSHFLKADAALTFWVTTVLFFSIKILSEGKLRYYFLSGATLGIASATQNYGALFAGSILAAHFLRESQKVSLQIRWKLLFSKKLSLAGFAAIGAFLAATPYVILDFKAFFSPVVDRLSWGLAVTTADERRSIIADTLGLLSVGMTWPLLGWLAAALLSALLGRRKNEWVILSWLLPWFCYMIASGLLATRFQMVIWPGAALLIASFICRVWGSVNLRKFTFVKVCALVLFIFSSLFSIGYAFAYDRMLGREPRQDVAGRWLIENVPLGATIGIPTRAFVERVPTVVHQDFFYQKSPELWKCRYKVFNIEYDVTKLREANPEYFVTSVRDGFGKYEGLAQDEPFPLTKELLDRYEVLKVFEEKTRLFGLEFKTSKAMLSDWHGPLYPLYILKRRGEG